MRSSSLLLGTLNCAPLFVALLPWGGLDAPGPFGEALQVTMREPDGLLEMKFWLLEPILSGGGCTANPRRPENVAPGILITS